VSTSWVRCNGPLWEVEVMKADRFPAPRKKGLPCLCGLTKRNLDYSSSLKRLTKQWERGGQILCHNH